MTSPPHFKTVSVIGLGYIGLPTAAMFASRRVSVVGVDVNQQAIDTINQGRIHIVEPELDMLVHAAVHEKLLRATRTPEPADAFLIAVPTPFKDGHAPDLTFVEAATRSIGPVLKRGDLIVLESTSPVGTTEQMVQWLAEARPDLTFPRAGADDADVCVAYCPERVLPGQVVRELVANDRVIGGITPRCSERACELYRVFVQGELLVSNARTAEMCKLTENAFRDVNIAFANELSLICDRLDINVWNLIDLANHHPRVNILRPGAGVGGHCIAVDPWFIVDRTPEQARLIRTAREVNDGKPDWVVAKVREAIASHSRSRPEDKLTVAVLGLAFKPNIDDVRESPALQIAKTLQRSSSARIVAVEPHIERRNIDGLNLLGLEAALVEADVVVLLVAHKAFRDVPALVGEGKTLIDAVGMARPTEPVR
jgi:UDP-N-acetyl-D-mannosaminuronic acid dehydrogenase